MQPLICMTSVDVEGLIIKQQTVATVNISTYTVFDLQSVPTIPTDNINTCTT